MKGLSRAGQWLVWMVLSGLAGGCVGNPSPPTRFYLLTPMAAAETGEHRPAGTERKRGPVVELEPVEIPQYLNRPEMVTRTGGNRLRLERMNQWAGDLKEDIGRILLENLSTILASDRVVILPNRGEGTPDFRLVTGISRFEADADGVVLLEARWTLFDGRGTQLLTRHSRITARAEEKEDYESLAAAMSRALGGLSREVGEAILSLPGRRTP